MSGNGGILTKGFLKKKWTQSLLIFFFFKGLFALQAKCINVIRENWGLERGDELATFGEDFNKRWQHFVKNHLVKDDKGIGVFV